MAASTISAVRDMIQVGKNESSVVERIEINWVADTSSGSVSSLVQDLRGELIKVEIIPAGGPTDNYDITLVDSNGLDQALGLLTNRDTVNGEIVYMHATGGVESVLLTGDITITITGQTDTSCSGKLILYLAE